MSVARGLAVLALIAALLVSVRLMLAASAPAGAASHPVCRTPIAILEGAEPRLGCGEEVAASCPGELAPGDLVELREAGCRVEPGGMGGAMRLLVRLPIEVNRASAAELELVDGIGPALAREIVEERERRGPFSSLADVERVRGIGPTTMARLGSQLSVSAP